MMGTAAKDGHGRERPLPREHGPTPPTGGVDGGGVHATPRSGAHADNPKQVHGDRKPPLHTIPSTAILELGVRMGDGARKYGAFNWRETGVRSMTYVAAMLRHLSAYADGETVDPECPYGSSHLAGIMACAAILVDCHARGNLIDDRPPPAPTGAAIRHYQEHGKLPALYADLAGG